MNGTLRVFVGFDPDEALAYAVCVASLVKHSSIPLDVQPLVQADLRAKGLYRRTEAIGEDGQRWCCVSDAPMATEFSNSRFVVPRLAAGGWALFCDSDFLWRRDVAELLTEADPAHAVTVVKHRHAPEDGRKMRGQAQTRYARKNWSSLILWNLEHEANRLVDAVADTWPGRALHALRWLMDDEVGVLPGRWNWLEGVDPQPDIGGPSAVHYTLGTPDMPGREGAAYAQEWWAVAHDLGLA